MDAQLLAYIKRHSYDLNALDYKVYHLPTGGNKEIGNFGHLTAFDAGCVQTWVDCVTHWRPGCSAFRAVWLALLSQGSPSLLKLYSTNDPAREIQGLLRLDASKPCEDASLRLLETAPDNQTGVPSRKYSGVGRALVARLVLQCYLTGQRTLIIRVHPRNVPFYRGLRFIESPQFPGRMALSRQNAEQFLTSFFF